jgi:hypothetical protein
MDDLIDDSEVNMTPV